MDQAPLIEFQPDGSLLGPDYARVKGAYEAARRETQVERYRGIRCGRCAEPFEKHLDDWTCPRRVVPRFAFPADRRPPSNQAAEELLREAREDTHLLAMIDPARSADSKLTGERIREAADRLAYIDTYLQTKGMSRG
jgi:hypothetical protein